MHCSTCQQTLPEGADYCPTCGSGISTVQPDNLSTQHQPESNNLPLVDKQEDISSSIPAEENPTLEATPTPGENSTQDQESEPVATEPNAEQDNDSSQDLLATGEPTLVEYSAPTVLETITTTAQPQSLQPAQYGPQVAYAHNPTQWHPQSRPKQRRQPIWPLTLLIVLCCLATLFVLENTGVLYYATLAHPAEVNRANTKLDTAAAHATDVANQLQTSQDFATTTVKKLNLAHAQLNAAPAQLYDAVTALQPKFDDPVNDATKSKWLVTDNTSDACKFQSNIYHITESTKDAFLPCDNSTLPIIGDFAFQVQMTIAAGDKTDSGGLLFRADLNNDKYYYFDTNADGFYRINLYTDSNPDHIQTLRVGSLPQFNTGLNQANLITIIAQGPTVNLYVNKQWVAIINDTTYDSGEIALLASCGGPQNTDVIFSNTKLWNLTR